MCFNFIVPKISTSSVTATRDPTAYLLYIGTWCNETKPSSSGTDNPRPAGPCYDSSVGADACQEETDADEDILCMLEAAPDLCHAREHRVSDQNHKQTEHRYPLKLESSTWPVDPTPLEAWLQESRAD